MTDQVLITTIDDRGVARLTMNRPELRNAFNTQLIESICDAMGRLSTHKEVRAVILTGAGKAFSGGADLNMMKAAAGFSKEENKDDARRLAHMLASIYHCPKPTIARVNGPAMGGGLGLIAACDIAIGSEDAFFALSEVRLGLIPAVISPFVIQAIGARAARRYFITGERFDAATAQRLELLHEITPLADLDTKIDETIGHILQCGPIAQCEARELIKAVAGRSIEDGVLNDTAERIARIRASAEGKEGINAFLEKRKASWCKE